MALSCFVVFHIFLLEFWQWKFSLIHYMVLLGSLYASCNSANFVTTGHIALSILLYE